MDRSLKLEDDCPKLLEKQVVEKKGFVQKHLKIGLEVSNSRFSSF